MKEMKIYMARLTHKETGIVFYKVAKTDAGDNFSLVDDILSTFTNKYSDFDITVTFYYYCNDWSNKNVTDVMVNNFLSIFHSIDINSILGTNYTPDELPNVDKLRQLSNTEESFVKEELYEWVNTLEE